MHFLSMMKWNKPQHNMRVKAGTGVLNSICSCCSRVCDLKCAGGPRGPVETRWLCVSPSSALETQKRKCLGCVCPFCEWWWTSLWIKSASHQWFLKLQLAVWSFNQRINPNRVQRRVRITFFTVQHFFMQQYVACSCANVVVFRRVLFCEGH